MEAFLRAELERAQERYEEAGIRFRDASVAMRTTYLVAQGVYDLYENVRRGRADYKNSKQFDSDFKAIESLWKEKESAHEANLKQEYAAKQALFDAKDHWWKIDGQLNTVINGDERWVRADERAAPSADHPDATRWRTCYDPATGTAYHFQQTYPPPPPPPPPKSSPPPPPPRSPSPPPRRSAPSPDPERPHLRRPKPFVRPTVRPSQSRIEAWHDSIATALANPSDVRTFPRPPWWLCERAGSGVKCPVVAVGLCQCCAADLFDGRDLKAERRKFHPDRFSRCPENARKAVQADAADVFKLVDALYEEEVADRRRGRKKYYWEY